MRAPLPPAGVPLADFASNPVVFDRTRPHADPMPARPAIANPIGGATRRALLLLALATGGCAAPRPPAPPSPATERTRPAPSPDTVRTAPVDTVRTPPPAPVVVPRRPTLSPRAIPPRRERRAGDTGLRVCAGGDLLLGTNLDTTWATRASTLARRPVAALPSPESLLRPLRPLVARADVVLLNVEGAVGEGVAPTKCGPGSTSCYAFRQPVAAAEAMRALSESAAVIGNLANNHARDAGTEGLDSTVSHLWAAGVWTTGTDTLATPVVTAYGDTVAFLGFHTSPSAPDARDLAAVRRHVTRAAARWSRVVVTVHIGAEGVGAQRTRDTAETYVGTERGNPVRFARTAVAAGADLVIGHGPHVLRAMEWRSGRLIAYSLGNLLTYGPFSFRPPIDRGAILCATLAPDGAVSAARLHPTRQLPPGRLVADRSARAARLVDSLSALDFPSTGARVLRDGSVVRRSAARRGRR